MLGRKWVASAIALAAGVALAGSSQAANVTWTVNGTFDDGGTFSGDFKVDPATDQIGKWNITTSTDGFLGVTYQPLGAVSSGTASDNGGAPRFDQNTFGIFLDELNLTHIPLSSASGGVINTLTGYETDDACLFGCFNSSRIVTGGTAIGVVPEPASWAMMLLGVVTIGVASRTRRRVVATV